MGVKPSDIDEVYWSHSLNDIRKVTGLKMQFEIARTASYTESLTLVAAMVFGKGDTGSSTPSKNVTVITDIAALAGTNKWG